LTGGTDLASSAQTIERKTRICRSESESGLQCFESQGSAQLFASTHAAFYNAFNVRRLLLSRRSFRHGRNEAIKLWLAAAA
jgi:hypothetical protein